jgi:protein ImuB
MRILCLHFPLWPIQRVLVADRALDPRRPIILHARDARRGQFVTNCNAAAWQHGVRPSMLLAEAAALAGRQCQIVPSNPIADLAALARLAEYCERFSPIVGWQTIDETPAEPDRLFLEIAGVAVLFGGEEMLAHEAVSDLARLGYTARVTLANTIGAAWALAVFQEPLPVSALRVPAETVDLLAQLGVTQIEQLLRLPRASLPARFGEQLVQRLDQFQGAAQETIIAHRPPPEFVAERALEYPTESRELIERIVVELVQRIAVALAECRRGAVQLSCRLAGIQPLVLRVGLFRPSANPWHLWDLLRMQLEQPVPSLVGRVTLAATLTAPLENRQRELFAGSRDDARQYELLIDRLSSRLGSDAVLRAVLTADPIPERAVEYVPLLEAAKRKQRPPLAHRPLLLRTPPLALQVVSVVPDGPPISFQLDGRQNTVTHWWGPERIESGWWRGRSARRDYYRIEIESGQRYWLFRNLLTGKWFLHGEYV